MAAWMLEDVYDDEDGYRRHEQNQEQPSDGRPREWLSEGHQVHFLFRLLACRRVMPRMIPRRFTRVRCDRAPPPPRPPRPRLAPVRALRGAVAGVLRPGGRRDLRAARP